MPPLDRYLSNLAKLLPAAQREDILRELSEDIHSEMEEKESTLGRLLTEAEQLELLKRRGNPMQVAAGYTQNKGTFAFGPQIVGPVLFPFYVRVLTFNLGLTFLIVGAIFAILTLAGQPYQLGNLFSSVMLQIIIQLSAVTLIFSLVEKHLSRTPWNFDKDDFEKTLHDTIEKKIGEKLRSTPREVSRFDSIAVFVASSIALLWLQSLWAKPFLVFGPAASVITFAPVWHRIYLPTVIVTLAAIVRAAVNIAQPTWVRFRDIAAALLDLASLAIIGMLLIANSWIIPGPTLASNPSAVHLAQIVDRSIGYSIWVVLLIALAQVIHSIVRLYKNWRWGSPTANQTAA